MGSTTGTVDRTLTVSLLVVCDPAQVDKGVKKEYQLRWRSFTKTLLSTFTEYAVSGTRVSITNNTMPEVALVGYIPAWKQAALRKAVMAVARQYGWDVLWITGIAELLAGAVHIDEEAA